MVYEGGAHVLFDEDGRNVPDAVQEVSYVQNRVARMQHAQLRVSAMKLATAHREPMPVMKYIRSSPIHAWNSIGKAGVDEASRKANSLLPNALPADISCRLTLRVVSLQLMNALQVWRILNAGAVLTSPHPFTTLAEMRRRMTGTILPRQFIASVLNSRGLPGRTREIGTPPPSPETSNRSIVPTFIRNGCCAPLLGRTRASPPPDLPDLRFKKRDFIEFFNMGEGLKRRLAKTFVNLGLETSPVVEGRDVEDRALHVPSIPADLKGLISTRLANGTERRTKKSGKNCFLCSSKPIGIATIVRPGTEDGGGYGSGLDSDRSGDSDENRTVSVPRASESRVQCKTKYVCIDCGGIFLCRVLRWRRDSSGTLRAEDRTCWDKFHSDPILRRQVYERAPSALHP